ncbi:MAG TPA: hypothetical protein VM871_09865 [Flavisolibacter sp.]|jgi:tetratricopeptide (TPR) repeat protein|nr:hypothetical protein [Flavisolibacter sp.]
MKKKFTYLALVILFFSATAFVVLRMKGKVQNKVTAFYPLKERKGQLASAPDWAVTKERGDKLIRIVRDKPEDTKSVLALATLYIQEGRASGDYTYYNEAALKYIDGVLAAEPKNFEALILKSVVELSAHHFAEGLQTAEKAKAINPYNAYVYGLITDGNVELGNYKAAVENLDKMVSIRPDLRSYSRISYLREIHGDIPGAIEAMKQAVEAGLPGDEGTEWARVQLAKLYEYAGDAKAAEMHYTVALQQRPGYAYAIAGLGNIAAANKDYQKASSLYNQADTSLQDLSFKEKLAETSLLAGDKEKADKILNTIIDAFTKAAKEGETSINHHADKELAAVYLLKNDFKKSLEHAVAEYSRRPANIEVNEGVAWALYKAGNVQRALPYLDVALKTGSKNPTLLCRAGLIYAKAGNKEKAKELLAQGLKVNPLIDPLLLEESRTVQKTL